MPAIGLAAYEVRWDRFRAIVSTEDGWVASGEARFLRPI
jgi:hypothetical protein